MKRAGFRDAGGAAVPKRSSDLARSWTDPERVAGRRSESLQDRGTLQILGRPLQGCYRAVTGPLQAGYACKAFAIVRCRG